VVGIYTGREDNILWRRAPDRSDKLEAVGAKALSERDTEPMGHDIIHSVTNPIPRLSAAIHVYGGDFSAAERSEWDPETLSEQRWNAEGAVRRFEEANKSSRPAERNHVELRPSRHHSAPSSSSAEVPTLQHATISAGGQRRDATLQGPPTVERTAQVCCAQAARSIL
jgi:hypothetical protein